MRVRTYDADLRDPPVAAGAVSVTPVRRVRLRHVKLQVAQGGGGLAKGAASPAYLLVRGSGDPVARKVLLADRTPIATGAIRAAVSMITRATNRRGR